MIHQRLCMVRCIRRTVRMYNFSNKDSFPQKDGYLLLFPLLKHSITLGLEIYTMLIVIRKLLI